MAWRQPIPSPEELDTLFGDDNACKLLYKELIYRACNKDAFFTHERTGKTVQLKRGQVVFGRHRYAKLFEWDDKKCERKLEKLEKVYKLVSKTADTSFTIVELKKYDLLVSFDQENVQAVTKRRPSSVQAVTTSEIDKSVKSERVKDITLVSGETAPELTFWKEKTGTTIRKKIPENIEAAHRLKNALSPGDFIRLVETVRLIRADNYSGTYLKVICSYLQLEKNLDQVEAYRQGLEDSKQFQEVTKPKRKVVSV